MEMLPVSFSIFQIARRASVEESLFIKVMDKFLHSKTLSLTLVCSEK